MTGVINIDFDVFFYMVIALFGLAGFIRGWWKEALTSGLLVSLLVLLEYPDLAQQFIDKINAVIDLFRKTDAFNAAESIHTLQYDQKEVYIIVMIILIIISYFVGNAGIDHNVTTGGRIFGGILGFTNGFIILSLLKEYILGRFLPNSRLATELGAAAFTPAAVPETLTLSVSNVPQASITDGYAIWIFIIGGIILFLFALSSRFSISGGKIAKRPPMGYK
jgi:hypothetical protein